MADRTKMGRDNAGKGASHVETQGDSIRSALNQNPNIPSEWVDAQLEDQHPIQTVGNQQAGPTAEQMNYYPTGQASVKRKGLEGGTVKLPHSGKYN